MGEGAALQYLSNQVLVYLRQLLVFSFDINDTLALMSNGSCSYRKTSGSVTYILPGESTFFRSVSASISIIHYLVNSPRDHVDGIS